LELLADHARTAPADLAVSVLVLDPATGLPTSTSRIVPTFDSTSAVVLAPEGRGATSAAGAATDTADAAAVEAASGEAADMATAGAFAAPPDSAFTEAGALTAEYAAWLQRDECLCDSVHQVRSRVDREA
jgi:hypothetical protein